jgi:hypothetical protein
MSTDQVPNSSFLTIDTDYLFIFSMYLQLYVVHSTVSDINSA